MPRRATFGIAQYQSLWFNLEKRANFSDAFPIYRLSFLHTAHGPRAYSRS